MENIHFKAIALHKAFFASIAEKIDINSRCEETVEERDKLWISNAVIGEVITRFPPEASGFLHIGHAKAALINRMLADKYKGKMLFRFDDTNPSKEKEHFEEAIENDLKTMNVRYDSGPTYSSDYFEPMFTKAEEMIREGLAYCDQSPREEMQKCRFDGIATRFRDNSVEENLRMWNEMKCGSDEGQLTCLRAKISVDDPNKAMRDPVMYRVNLTPHARHGDKYKAYPTYDFCCPYVDSIEGITHALRTNEYHDRNAQYYWFCDAMRIRKPLIEDFSRLNMEFTVMSKRKLTKLVETGVVDGWDDPRFPTLRALVRRGMKIDALRQFVAEQGMSKTVNFMQWSKLWFLNTQILDPITPRYTAVSDDLKVKCVVENQAHLEECIRALHKKDPSLGSKLYYKSDVIYMDAEDIAQIKDGDEVTLMDWCNAFIRSIEYDNHTHLPINATITLHPDGDVKKTKYKFTWVPETSKALKLTLKEYDHILTKEKPDPEENIDDLISPVSIYTQHALGEVAMSVISKGDIVQLERRGYYIVDKDDGEHKTLILIPDGRDKINHLSAKAQYMKTLPKKASAKEELAAKKAAKAAKKAAQKNKISNNDNNA